jgi:hypothetical protein
VHTGQEAEFQSPEVVYQPHPKFDTYTTILDGQRVIATRLKWSDDIFITYYEPKRGAHASRALSSSSSDRSEAEEAKRIFNMIKGLRHKQR